MIHFLFAGKLVMRRTCSLEININIHLDSVCRYEKYGNGYLCMCDSDDCNAAWRPSPTSLTSALAVVATLGVTCLHSR